MLENTDSDHSQTIFKPLADGCPGIMLHQSADGNLVQHDKKLPQIFLYGQTTRPVEIVSGGRFKTFGVVFQPDALKSVFGIDANELTNSCTDFIWLQKSMTCQITEQISHLHSFADQSAFLFNSIFALVNKSKCNKDSSVAYAISQIATSKGHVDFKNLLTCLQLSERTFERRFKQSVGISPKLFARICKFQASLELLRMNKYEKLSDIAFESEYADQSHFIRAFKEFSGFSPYQYQKRTNEVAENFITFFS